LITQNQIILLGAGVIGLSQALYLLKNGFSVTLIDKRLHPDTQFKFQAENYDSRVFALTPQTANFLQELGVWEEIINKRACRYTQMKVWDGKGSSQIVFNAASLGVFSLGYITEHSIILQALVTQAKQYIPTGKLIWRVAEPIELIQEENQLVNRENGVIGLKLSDNATLYAKLIIGADGANSWLRTAAGLSCQSQAYDQKAIVATIQSEKLHDNIAYQRFSEGGPLALLPLSDPHKISIVWTQPTQLSDILLNLSDAEFNHRLTDCSEGILGKLTLSSDRTSFNLKSLQAKSYGSKRVALVGDSAHVIHPLAGLGANLGFQDVMCLGALLIHKQQQNRDLGSEALIQRYYRERIGKNEAIRQCMTVLNKLFMSQDPMIKLIRNWGVDKVNSIPVLKKWFAHQAMGL
jgi:2-octaprenylphenol hydroxylase